MTTTTLDNATALTTRYAIGGYPAATTLGELKTLAQSKSGVQIVVATYGGGVQVEVRKNVNGYHGRRMVRVQCYDVA